MGNQIVELRDKSQLLSALQKSLQKKQTATDILEQRVSFVFGSLSTKSNVTRQRVKEILEQQDGAIASK
jgi:hypothetical protein